LFQPLAARLLAVRPHERQTIWEQYLSALPSLEPAAPTEVELIREAEPAPELDLRVDRHQQPLEAETTPESDQRVRLTRARDVKPAVVEWLWKGRVPLGMLTMFAGDPKLGKSYVTLAMAAAVSRGMPLPGESGLPPDPGSVVLMSAEDHPAQTIVPRLIAAGADTTKVHILESVTLANGSEALPSLRADIDAILPAAAALGDCRLIVIDPVSAYLRGIDDTRNAALRGVLAPLKSLAERLGAAVVLVSHLNKGSSGTGLYRVQGSIAYVGACRANHLFVADPDDPSGRRVLMLDTGGNIAEPAPPLAFTIKKSELGAHVVWCDESMPITVADALRPRPRISASELMDARECDEWLRGFLENGSAPSSEVFKAASDAGFTRDQVKDAKYRIRAVAQKHGFQNGTRWTWQLPEKGDDLPAV
jgi:hypothetical protein